MLPTVKWYIGQPLMPDNWHLMNDSINEYTFDLVNFISENNFGIAKLEIDTKMLDFQLLRLCNFMIVMPSGEYFDLNVNTKCSNMILSEISDNRTEVYINITPAPPEDYLYRGSNIKTYSFNLELSETPDSRADSTFKLCELKKTVENKWEIDTTYIPPCMTLNNSIGKMLLEELQLLSDKIISHYNSMIDTSEALVVKKSEFRPCTEKAFEFKRICDLSNTTKSEQHPHKLFAALFKIYVKISLFFNVTPRYNFKYNHFDIYNSITQIKNKIDELLSCNYHNYKILKFESKNCRLTVDSIPHQY